MSWPSLPMRPESISSQCLRVLSEGPATTGEIAAEVGITSRQAGVYLTDLYDRKHVTRQPFDNRRDAMGRVKAWLWSIPTPASQAGAGSD